MSEVVFSGANNVVYDDASTRDVTLSLLQSGSSLSSPSGFSSIDKIVESNENKFNFTPERHSSPVQFDTSLEHMTSDTRPGHESFLTSLESVTSLTNVTSTGEDFGCFEGGYPFQQPPPEQNTIEEYVLGSNQIAYNQSDRLNPNHLLQELTNSNGHQFEQGFPGQEAADGNSTPLWRPTVYESSALQNYNDQQQNICHSNPLVSPNQSQRGPDTSDHVIDLTESVTSLDDDSNSSGSIQSIYCSVPDTATPNHNYELYSRHGDSFHEEPYPVEYYSQQCGSAAPSYSHVVSSQPPVDKPYYQQPSFPDTYPHRSAPNVFEVAVAENSTTWGQPPTALISQEELNMKIPNHSESDQSGSDTPALVAPTMTLHDGLAAESQFARKRPTIELSNRELWLKFFELGTEMIITKAGRRMFPAVKLNIRDLDPNKNYALAIEILPVDNNRYRYVYHSSQWMAAGTTEASTQPCTYFHPDSPSRGDLWMRQPISFDKLKLTNYEMNRKGHVILHSMHKYQPRIHLIECHTNRLSELESLLSTTNDVPSDDVTTVVFPECAFTTVTAYQNQQITKLKIDRNPFAKGFRDSNKQWKQKTTAEKTNKVWSRHGESPHGHTATIPNTIDLGNAQHNNNPHQLQQFQHNSVNQFTQGPVYNNNLNQQSDDGLTITHSLLAKTITNNSTGPNIFHTPSFQHQQPKHNDVITPCASNRDDSMTSRQEVSDFIPFSIYSNIPFQREQRNPAGSNDFANFTPSGGVGGLEVGLDALLYPEHAQQVTAAFDKQHQPLCSEP